MIFSTAGRFGNQADHFLGALRFSKALNRTLILPPWIEYRQGELRSIQIPFSAYFQVEPLQEYHRVITMNDFMQHLAYDVWPEDSRRSFCYMERKSLTGSMTKDCHAKEGNPFGPFWDEFQINFAGSEFFAPLNYDVFHSPNMIHKWQQKYPAESWPVLAFTGAPAAFPVQKKNLELQKYLVWTAEWQEKAKNWVRANMPKGAYIGIHMRNGVDWARACEHIKESPSLFSAAQCVGYRNERGTATTEMCMPPKELIIKQLKRQIKLHNGKHPSNNIKAIFVASDSNHMIADITEALKKQKIKAFRTGDRSPHLDLVILERSNLFIANCISSFSAFVKRSRDIRKFPSAFWAFPKDAYLSDTNKNKVKRDEL